MKILCYMKISPILLALTDNSKLHYVCSLNPKTQKKINFYILFLLSYPLLIIDTLHTKIFEEKNSKIYENLEEQIN